MGINNYRLEAIVAVRWDETMADAFPDAEHDFCRQNMMWTEQGGWQAHCPPECQDWHCPHCGQATNMYGHHICYWDCVDCGINTAVIDEYYSVGKELWDAHGAGDGMLCVGCLESRVGRKLGPSDFPNLPINRGAFRMSSRLRDRVGGNW